MKLILLFIVLFVSNMTLGQQPTRVVLNLQNLVADEMRVRVYSPEPLRNSEFVIPQIVPGTYMKINYVQFYNDFSAYDSNGQSLPVSRKDNVYHIKGSKPLHYVEYSVMASLGNRKFWDNIISCAGTIITPTSTLLNFQLITGYFEDYKNSPFEIEVIRPVAFYGASSINKVTLNDSTDLLRAERYADLIDQPVLYAKPDTTSFVVKGHKFNIAVHAENSKNSALKLKPSFQKIVNSIHDFSGFTSKDDYSFILYFVDENRLKGLVKTFGAGAALEHKHSSVYYDLDIESESSYYYNSVVPHEYFHTITPLGFSSEKINNFNFRKPEMSQHVWLYEGVTDYFSYLTNAKYLNKSPMRDIVWSIDTSLKRKRQSMTESGEQIIRKKNIISWITKMVEIGNFYNKGKLIAMGLDMAIMEKSNGEKRLIDLMLDLKNEYENKSFKEEDLKAILIAKGIPGVKSSFETYIEGSEIPPYNDYLKKLGWQYIPAKSKLPSYGNFNIAKVQNDSSYYINWAKKNNLGLQEGDILVAINGVKINPFSKDKEAYQKTIRNPELTDTLTVTYLRKGIKAIASSKPSLKKLKRAKVVAIKNPSEEQIAFRKMFFGWSANAKE